ncbi:helix-hairpin-helix domain-containing protein [Chitinophaga ginsengisegetis]|uniref:ComEA family DNA-binding protein n=1 Tax=Chitinophaga ginsengisegetis TaxID=393003 RepID=UPI0034393FE9
MWKSFAREYLRFSRKERHGILMLALLMILTSYLPDLLFYFQRRPVTGSDDLKAAVTAFEAGLAAAEKEPALRGGRYVPTGADPGKAALFYFDPNTLPASGWQQLGVSERTATTIGKYLARGGHFRVPADLEKIYSLPPALCAQLIPYVRIADKGGNRFSGRYGPRNGPGNKDYSGGWGRGSYYHGDSNVLYEGSKNKGRFYYQDSVRDDASFTRYRKKPPAAPIDINTADSVAWQSLPGIGAGFARRIIAFRDRLGGFYAVEQVGECYGLPDSTFQKIQPFLQIGSSSLKKLDLNLTDEKSLAAHPYIRYKLARLIVQYRSSHAGFRSVSDLRSLPLVDEIIYRKIEHYIEIKY